VSLLICDPIFEFQQPRFQLWRGRRGVSFGRHVNSVGEEQFPPQVDVTSNAPNAGPRVGPVVMTEIHYHPTPGNERPQI
jgi:hypothetical protein